jgi:hypothetical protein
MSVSVLFHGRYVTGEYGFDKGASAEGYVLKIQHGGRRGRGTAPFRLQAHVRRQRAKEDEVSSNVRSNIHKAISQREFMPQILKLYGVSSFVTPSTWDIETDRGRTSLLLKGEEDIRRLSGTVLLVTDGHGVQFLIRDLAQMDRFSRKLLDRFL